MKENKARAQAKLEESRQQAVTKVPAPFRVETTSGRRPAAPQAVRTKGNMSRTWRKQFPYRAREKHRNYSNSKFPAKYSGFNKSIGRPTFDVNCALTDYRRFRIECGFNECVVAVCRNTKGSTFNAASKTWSIGLEDHADFIEQLSKHDEIKVCPLPAWIVATFQGTQQSAISAVDFDSIDKNLVATLMPFQKEGVEFGIRNKGRVLIADDMGLGKTIQAIGIASYYCRDWPLLIICPSSVRMMWADALVRWLPSLEHQDIIVAFNTKTDLSSGLVTIVSYDLAVRLQDKLRARGFQIVIADESHCLKNYKALRSSVCLPLLKSSKRTILLSGTPALSRPSELFTQIEAVAPKLFPSFIQFGVRYCNGHKSHFGWDFSGSSNLEELQLLLEEKVMIRRLKACVLSQLPDKFRQVVKLDPSLVKVNKIKQAEEEFMRATQSKRSEKHSALLNFYSSTAEAKCSAVVDYISDLMESGSKVLIFAHHQRVMDAVCNTLDSKKYDYIRIDGKTAGEDRLPLCEKFQQISTVMAAVLSVTAANTGINLTAASLVVFAELYWNPGVLIQAEDRVHRIGQKNSVNIRYLIASGTADDYMWHLLQTKLNVLGKAGLSKDDFRQSDYEMHLNSKQKTIEQYLEGWETGGDKKSLSSNEDDGSEWFMDDEFLEGLGELPDEPDTKRPRLQDHHGHV